MLIRSKNSSKRSMESDDEINLEESDETSAPDSSDGDIPLQCTMRPR